MRKFSHNNLQAVEHCWILFLGAKGRNQCMSVNAVIDCTSELLIQMNFLELSEIVKRVAHCSVEPVDCLISDLKVTGDDQGIVCWYLLIGIL